MSALPAEDLRYHAPLMQRHPAPFAPPKRKILAVVDGTARSADVIDQVIAQSHTPQEVVVLNVQPEPEDWRLRGYGWFKRDEIRDRLVNDLGRPIVAHAVRRLQSAGITYRQRIEIGQMAEIIARCANEEGCDQIIVAVPRGGALRRWLARRTGISIGSIVCQLLELTVRPVLLVR